MFSRSGRSWHSANPEAPQTLTRIDGLVAAALALLLVIAASVRMVPGVTGVVHDDGVYVTTARALADGHGYHLINLPGEPRQTKYPPIYPALLAVVWWAWPDFPANVVLMQWLTIGAAAAAVAGIYLYLVRFRYAGRLTSACAVAACATAPAFVYLATLTMSEMVFALVAVGALWRTERAISEADPSPGSLVRTGLIVALPFLCRSIGIALTVVALALLVRQGRRALWAVAGSAVVAGGWLLWTVPAWGTWSGVSVSGFYTDYLGASMIGRDGALTMIAGNGLLVIMGTAGEWLDGIRRGLLQTSGGTPVWLVVGAIAWFQIFADARRGRLLPACLLGYACVVVSWPWPPARLLIPVLPWLAAYALAGATNVVARLAPPVVRWWAHAVVAVSGTAMVGNLLMVGAAAGRSAQIGFPVDGVVAVSAETSPGEWRDYAALFGWIRRHTDRRAVIAAGLDTMVFLYTDRQAFRPVAYRPEAAYGIADSAIGDARDVLHFLREGQATHVVLVPGFPDWRELGAAVEALRAEHPGALRSVYRGSDARYEILEVVPAAWGASSAP
jgi:hypothetical protein